MNKKIISYIIIALIVAVGLFYGGVKYGQAHTTTNQFSRGSFSGGANGANRFNQGGRGGLAGGGFIAGQILSVDGKSITISLQGGGSKLIFLSASTTVVKAVSGSKSDLVAGENVTVAGGANSDGSLNAQSIQIRPATGMARAQ